MYTYTYRLNGKGTYQSMNNTKIRKKWVILTEKMTKCQGLWMKAHMKEQTENLDVSTHTHEGHYQSEESELHEHPINMAPHDSFE